VRINKGEAHLVYLFVPVFPVIAFWLLDGWYLRKERLFRCPYDAVRTNEGTADFDGYPTIPKAVGSVMQVSFSQALLLFYGPVLIVPLLLESLLLHNTR
jgi:hypothetical protein